MQLWPRGSATVFVEPQSMIVARVLNFELLLGIYEICLGLESCKITHLMCTAVVGLDVLARCLMPIFYAPCFFHSRHYVDLFTVP